MIRSMTGYGEARGDFDGIGIRVEVRSVNNRYLKVVTRLGEPDMALEQAIEKLIREQVNRGTVNVTVHLSRAAAESRSVIDTIALTDYWDQLRRWQSGLVMDSPGGIIGHLLALPGVVREPSESDDGTASGENPELLAAVMQTATAACEALDTFRMTEGESMKQDLADQQAVLIEGLEAVLERAPQVVAEYRDKILARVQDLLTDSKFEATEENVIREVSIFSDRVDINEEITRLKAHLEQFTAFMDDEESRGRKLEFLTQELYRETNTIGSKANDLTLSHVVVDMKAAIEKIREILQNVE